LIADFGAGIENQAQTEIENLQSEIEG